MHDTMDGLQHKLPHVILSTVLWDRCYLQKQGKRGACAVCSDCQRTLGKKPLGGRRPHRIDIMVQNLKVIENKARKMR